VPINPQLVEDALKAVANGEADHSGKTPLDNIIESFQSEPPELADLRAVLSSQISLAIVAGPSRLKVVREFLRRLKVRDADLAAVVRQKVQEGPSQENTEIRLWLSLILMDLGFPRSVKNLNNDSGLRSLNVGQWLTLVAANKDFPAVQDAFVKATKENLLSVEQLALKSEVIRKQFGDKLTEFLSVTTDALSGDAREKFRKVTRDMYGIDAGHTPSYNDLGFEDDNTERLLRSIKEDAISRLKEAA